MTPAALRELRESLGLSTAEMSEKCGVTIRNYQRWESGGTPIIGTAAKLLEIFRTLHAAGLTTTGAIARSTI